MTNEEIYRIWRPDDSLWSAWVKPVVFAFLRPGHGSGRLYSIPNWHIPLNANTAIIADLPGVDGVLAGIALARTGYRPVVIYNACPSVNYHDEPEILSVMDSSTPMSGVLTGLRTLTEKPVWLNLSEQAPPVFEQRPGPPVAVDMSDILAALCATSKELLSVNLSAQSPPVFLLDANRHGFGIHGPGWFDNRSFVASSDFPSPDFLITHGISKLILLQHNEAIAPDLLPVLLRLQEKGIAIATQVPRATWAPQTIVVRPPMFLKSVWRWLRQKLGYPYNSLNGSFGGIVPPSAG